MNVGAHFTICEPIIGTRTDENGNTVMSSIRKAFVLWAEDISDYLMDEIIEMLRKNGITDLYVLNRDFILAAIREKIEREAKP